MDKFTEYLISMESNNPKLESKTAILRLLNIENPDHFLSTSQLAYLYFLGVPTSIQYGLET